MIALVLFYVSCPVIGFFSGKSSGFGFLDSNVDTADIDILNISRREKDDGHGDYQRYDEFPLHSVLPPGCCLYYKDIRR